jgi:hypothetical protein
VLLCVWTQRALLTTAKQLASFRAGSRRALGETPPPPSTISDLVLPVQLRKDGMDIRTV